MMSSLHLVLIGLVAAGDAEPTSVQETASTPPPLLFDVDLVGRLWASGREPETSILFDPATGLWRVDDWLQPRARKVYPSLVAIVGLEAEPLEGLGLRLLVDSGELRAGSSFDPPVDVGLTIDGREVGAGLSTLARLRELAVTWRRGPLTLELGRFYAAAATSLTYEDFGTGLRAGFDLTGLGLGPWQLEAAAVAVGHTLDELDRPSPMLNLRLDYELSLFERLGIFGAAFFDRNGVFHDTLVSTAAEGFIASSGPELEQLLVTRLFNSEATTRGHLIYVGGEGNLLPAAGLSLRAQGSIAVGSLRVGPEAFRRDIEIRGYAASAEATYGVLPELGVTLFGLALSGDRPPADLLLDQTVYRSYLAVAPYWTWTGMFFSGGLSQGLFPARANAAGVNGHGVYGGGGRASWLWRDLRGELTVAGLWAAAAPLPGFGGGGRVYGLETDLTQSFELGDYLTVGLEADLFWPGSFFVQHRVAYRLLGMMRARLGN